MRLKKALCVTGICIFTLLAAYGNRLSGVAFTGAGANLQELIEEDDTSEAGDESGQDGKENEAGKDSEETLSESGTSNMKNLPESLSCTFVVPEDFYPSAEEPGAYFNEFYPLESANVTYSISEIPQDKVLTNAQKAAGESADSSDVEFRYDELTSEIYEGIQKENYEALYGTDIGFKVENFENREFDGFPGFLITTSFTPEGSQIIHQISAIVLSKNKIYTIVYSRAEDDDFEADIKDSIETIHVISKN